MQRSILMVVGVVASLAIPNPSHAHITLEAREAPTDSYFKAVFNVSHGCDGSPTTRIRIRIPDGVTGVKPQPKAGWELSTVKKKVEGMVTGDHGAAVSETISEVAWSGKLADEHFDQFMMQVRLPNAAPGTVLYFPVVQECEKGVNRWIELPEAGKAAGELREPAPQLRLLPKAQ